MSRSPLRSEAKSTRSRTPESAGVVSDDGPYRERQVLADVPGLRAPALGVDGPSVCLDGH